MEILFSRLYEKRLNWPPGYQFTILETTLFGVLYGVFTTETDI